MKNNMIIGAILFIISLSNSAAQDGASVRASVAQSFEKNFSGATNLRWTFYQQNVSLARFNYSDRACLAYFDRKGAIISSGRKVSVQELPIDVNYGMTSAKERHEKKYGELTVGIIYEMVTDAKKEFFIPLVNEKIHLLISVATDGTVILKRKTEGKTEQKNPNVLARTN